VPSSKLNNWRITQLSQQLNNHMRLYGYKSVDLPIIEPADLFLIKAGDQIVNKLFTFERHGQQLALRPEFTAAAAYHYMTEYGDKRPVVRWQFSGYVFEDDSSDFVQNHQHFSIGAELIGMEGPIADAEIIGMAAQGLTGQNIPNWQLTLGHVGLIRQALVQFKLDIRTEHYLLSHLQALKDPDLGKSFVLEQVDQFLLGRAPTRIPSSDLTMETDVFPEANTQQMIDIMLDTTQRGAIMGGRTRQDIARRLLQKHRRTTERHQIAAAIDTLIQWGEIAATPEAAFSAISHLIPSEDTFSKKMLTEWTNTVRLLGASGVAINQIRIQPDLARFWDYYTGIVFEIRTSDGTHLGGGGRYDELSKLLGNKQNVPAVGFAYYGDELVSILPPTFDEDEQKAIIVVNANSAITGVQWADQLRHRGIKVWLTSDGNTTEYTGITMYANQDATLRLKNNHYRLAQIDMLIEELKRTE